MPAYEVSVYLSGGAKASIKIDAPNIGAVAAAMQAQLAGPAPVINLASNQGILHVVKTQFAGYTIDDV